MTISRAEALTRLASIVDGIDRDQTFDDDGWWETSNGVDFGNKVLRDLVVLVAELTEPECNRVGIQPGIQYPNHKWYRWQAEMAHEFFGKFEKL